MRLYILLAVLLGTWQGSFSENENFPGQASQNKSSPTIVFDPGERNGSLTAAPEKTTKREVTTKINQVNSIQDPLNILESLVKPNKTLSNIVTPEDFAQVTSLVINKKENKSNSDTPPSPPVNEDAIISLNIIPIYETTLSTDEKVVGVQPPPKENVSSEKDPKHDNSTLTEFYVTSQAEKVIPNAENVTNQRNASTTIPDVENLVEPVNNTNTILEQENGITYLELAKKMTSEIKVYSNEAVLSWEEIKEKVAWDNEGANVLRDYKEGITISRASNNSDCVKNDQVKLETRTNLLKEMLSSCESEIRRKEWHELQNRTKEILSIFNDIILKATVSGENLSNEENDNERDITIVEKEAKDKLKATGIEAFKRTLSELKTKALKSDEEDYRTCVNKKAENEIIVDSLKDIMRIKNNCVG